MENAIIDYETGEILIDDWAEQEWYGSLVEDCKAIITEAIFTSRWAIVEGYHTLGERIRQDSEKMPITKLLQRVAVDIKQSERTLWYAVQFYDKYPQLDNVPEGKNISWHKLVNKYLPAPKTIRSSIEDFIPNPSLIVHEGEIWQLGKHRIMCGDAYNQADISKLIGSDKIAALITDPPYGIGYEPDWNKWDGSPSDFNEIIGDDEEFDPSPFLSYPTIVIFGANYFSNRLPIGGWICWDKRLNEEKDNMFGSPFELAWYRSVNTTKKAIMIRVLHGGVVNADSTIGNNEKRFHPTQKPISVMEQILENTTKIKDIVLDPFSGVGSTLLAAENVGRKCLAMEILPLNVSITLQRWADKTGKKPKLVRE